VLSEANNYFGVAGILKQIEGGCIGDYQSIEGVSD